LTPNSDNQRVLKFIEELALGAIDIVTFTSQPQFKRLLSVAQQENLQAQLLSGLHLTQTAATWMFR
jgi:uroporphyrinogen-III synthase